MPPAQQEPNYLGRTFDRNRNASYDEYPYSAGISRGTGFPSDWETSQPSSSSGMSEAVALALRARQAAQLEDLQDDINFRPWACTVSNGCSVTNGCSAEGSTDSHDWKNHWFFFLIFFFSPLVEKKQRLQNVIWANLVLVKYRENKIKAQLFLMTVMF